MPYRTEDIKMVWLVSYRARTHRRGFDGSYSRFTSAEDFIGIIVEPPIVWHMNSRKRVLAIQDDNAAWAPGDSCIEIELIYSAIETPMSAEDWKWLEDHE